MTEQQEATLSIIYSVRFRRTRRGRVVVDLVRDTYSKQLCHYTPDGKLSFASKKPLHFFDKEDLRRIIRECGRFYSEPQNIGSIELKLFLFKGPYIEVRFISGELLGRWDPEKGLRLAGDAHPAFAGDRKHIAKVCSELPQGGGGIFQGELEEQPTL